MQFDMIAYFMYASMIVLYLFLAELCVKVI